MRGGLGPAKSAALSLPTVFDEFALRHVRHAARQRLRVYAVPSHCCCCCCCCCPGASLRFTQHAENHRIHTEREQRAFGEITTALRTVGIDDARQGDIWRLLVGIIGLQNLQFKGTRRALPSGMPGLEWFLRLTRRPCCARARAISV